MLKLMFVITSVGLLSLTGKVNADPVTVVAGVDDQPSGKAQFVISNETDGPIKYQVKWGESGQWYACVLRSHYLDTHSRALEADGSFPGPHVRFYDGSGGSKDYRMQCANGNNHYMFQHDGGGRYLELYKNN